MREGRAKTQSRAGANERLGREERRWQIEMARQQEIGVKRGRHVYAGQIGLS